METHCTRPFRRFREIRNLCGGEYVDRINRPINILHYLEERDDKGELIKAGHYLRVT